MEKEKNRISIKNFEQKQRELEGYANKGKNPKDRSLNSNKTYSKEAILSKRKLVIGVILALVISCALVIGLYKFIGNLKFNKKLEELNYTKEDIKRYKEEIKELQYLKEDKRARKYLGQFVKNIKEEKYDEEYFKLYDEYRGIFFPTQNDFEIYLKENFPKDPVISFKNFERIGDLFILFVDIVNKEDFSKSLYNMKFVFKEEDLNRYVFSFSVKTLKDKNEKYITPPDEMDFREDKEVQPEETDEIFDLITPLKEEEMRRNLELDNKEREERKKRREQEDGSYEENEIDRENILDNEENE